MKTLLCLFLCCFCASCSHVAHGVVTTALAIKGRKPAEWRLAMTEAYVYDEEVRTR
jgi:hypothetical protein